MPSFSISYTSSMVTISVSGRGDYYCRFYCRTEIVGGTYSVIGDSWGHSDYMMFSGLSPGTTYVVNVAYATSVNGPDTTWIGSQTFTTPAASRTYYGSVSYNAGAGSNAPSAQTSSYPTTADHYTFSFTVQGGSTPPGGYQFDYWTLGSTNYYPGDTITVYATSTSSSSPTTVVLTAHYSVLPGPQMNVFDGTSWVVRPLDIYNGSSWVSRSPNIGNGGWS